MDLITLLRFVKGEWIPVCVGIREYANAYTQLDYVVCYVNLKPPIKEENHGRKGN